MGARTGLATLLLAALTGCGGGSVSVGLSAFSIDQPFVVWAGNSSHDQVVDANNDAFAFYADTGCLYNFRTGRENTHFCLTSARGIARYGQLFVRIVNVRSVTGTCIAALIDEASARFVDIEIDSFGREVVFITTLGPDFCPI